MWRKPGDPNLYRAIAGVWGFGLRTRVRSFPPGVYRHRTVEDLQDQRARWNTLDS
ncbi:MAG: hypothetical protein WBP10_12155 [Thermoanaerobaculia bacterium]